MYSKADLIILNKARELARNLSAEDCAQIQVKEPVPFKKRGPGKSYKPKGGHAPIDYDAIDTLNDLRRALRSRYPDVERVLPLYMRLRSLVKG